MRVATHSGSFHADDLFALAALGLVDPALEVVRTRDPALLEAADLRVDVGLRDDPATGDFDHHQRGGAGARENGIRFASFGLVWKHFGAEVCDGSAEVARLVDEELVQTIDAHDNGQALAEALVPGARLGGVSSALGALNPVWDEADDVLLERFHEGVGIAQALLAAQVRSSAARARSTALVAAAIAAAEDPRVIVLDRGMPWHEAIVGGAPEALYVVLPKSSGWGVQCVPVAPGSFANRRDLPEAWAGRSDEELVAVTGVADAVFCHPGRFLAVARSRAGAQALVALALTG